LVMAEIEAETNFINRIMEKIVHEIEAADPVGSDLNSLIDDAAQQLLGSVPFPVVVHTSLFPELPGVLLPGDFLRALILRALSITAEHQGPGCELRVASNSINGKVAINITAIKDPNTTEAHSKVPLQIRGASLTQLIEEVGGEMLLEEQTSQIALTVRLAHAVPTN
ncbi:MAG: hypothetical protein V3U11_00065, partial [Planctomycetota bacterium]